MIFEQIYRQILRAYANIGSKNFAIKRSKMGILATKWSFKRSLMCVRSLKNSKETHSEEKPMPQALYLTEIQKETLQKVNILDEYLVVGAWPGSSDLKLEEKIQSLLRNELKVSHFINLMEEAQQKEQRFKPYKSEIGGLTYTQFDIPDNGIADDFEVCCLVDKLHECIKKKERLYIHCWGGNGRTTTVATLLLAKIYDLTWQEALLLICRSYNERKIPLLKNLPESEEQFNQIKRLIKKTDLENNMSYSDWTKYCRESQIIPKGLS